jgi:hypothetical protein
LACCWFFCLIALALALGERPTKRRLLLLGLLFGLAVGHHRTLVFLGPALLAAAWPALKLGWRIWLGSAVLAVASLLVYLYLPLVAWAGSPWIYGRSPATWEGFMDAFLAREYSYRLLPPTTLPEIGAALIGRLQYLTQEMSSLGLAAGLFGFVPGLLHAKTRRLAGVLLLAFCGYWLAPISQGLLIRSYMMILVASFTLAAAWGVGLVALGRWQRWLPPLGLLLTAFIAFQNVSANQSYILFHTKDETGQQLIRDAATLPGEQPMVGEIWSPRFFPLAYGQLVTGELAHVDLVDLRGDLSGLPDESPPLIFVSREALYAAPPGQWQARYDTAVSLSSHGQRMVAIRPSPVIAPIDPQPLAASAEIQLVAVSRSASETTAELLDDGTLFVQLLWQATQPPTRNYSVFVHVTDREQILGPDLSKTISILLAVFIPPPTGGLANWCKTTIIFRCRPTAAKGAYRPVYGGGRRPFHQPSHVSVALNYSSSRRVRLESSNTAVPYPTNPTNIVQLWARMPPGSISVNNTSLA